MTDRTTKGTAVAEDHAGEVIIINLDALLMLEGNQIRAKTCMKTVKHYAELMRGGETFVPIKVALTDATDEAKGFTLVDGWHRVTATQRNGGRTIEAVVIVASPDEIPWLAAVANKRHGLPLSRADKRNIFRAYVRAGKHRTGRGNAVKSARTMEADLNGIVSRHQLPVWMLEEFPAIHAAMHGNGLEADDGRGGLKPLDMDREYEKAASAKMDEFMACARAISDTRVGRRVLLAAAQRVTEVAQAVTGRQKWPEVKVMPMDSDF